MSTPDSAADTIGQPSAQEGTPTGSLVLPDFLPPARIIAQLSVVRTTQPIAALAAVNQHQAELADVFLQAIGHGLEDPMGNFAKEGMLFNYAAYFLAKWRDQRAYPLFVRWFALPGEEALELGGDTLLQHGSRLLASVWNRDIGPLQELILNREANPACRSQALGALAVLTAWGEWPRAQAESTFLALAREGLERVSHPIWNALAILCVQLEFLSVFGELRRAQTEGLLDVVASEDLEKVEQAPRGTLMEEFTKWHPPITDVIAETRWWAGFARNAQPDSVAVGARGSAPYTAPPKVGRNDNCPCGSGKKFKKCCGA